MTKEMLQLFITTVNLSVVEAMAKIDHNVRGILFVLNEQQELIGSVTDGDIRRWLIKTGDLNATIDHYMNRSPKFLLENHREQAFTYMKEQVIKAVPILNEHRHMIDIIFAEETIGISKANDDSLKNTKVIIMAGGKGTRLYPYTKILPKPLIPIGEVPILERIIHKFCDYGISQYYLTVNYKKGMIKSYFAEINPVYKLHYIEEDQPLGTAGSIKLIPEEFTEPVIITNCDTLIDVNYEKVMAYHITSNNALTIVSALKHIVVPYGVMYSKEHGVVTAMEEKPKLSYFINTGLYVLDPILIKKIPDNTMFHMTQLAQLLMNEGYQVGMYPISEDAFLDMGEFEEMKRMEQKLKLAKEL